MVIEEHGLGVVGQKGKSTRGSSLMSRTGINDKRLCYFRKCLVHFAKGYFGKFTQIDER